ncbi:MAG TPA: hypothetical protein VKU41_21620 [Polyangiaceae bacterium]|nr:hypothetical protein [Polyangiaceae bacterium]
MRLPIADGLSLAVLLAGCSSTASGPAAAPGPEGQDSGANAVGDAGGVVSDGATSALALRDAGALDAPPNAAPDARANGPDDAGANGIYKACGPLVLAKTYSDSHLTLGYPADWTGSAVAANAYALDSSPYSYLPTGSTAPAMEVARVEWLTPATLDPSSVPETVVAQTPSGYPGAVVRHFQIQGGAAAAWWYAFPPATCGECQGPGDPGPDFIAIGVAAVHADQLIELDGTVRSDAPDAVFCAVQAIEASLALP